MPRSTTHLGGVSSILPIEFILRSELVGPVAVSTTEDEVPLFPRLQPASLLLWGLLDPEVCNNGHNERYQAFDDVDEAPAAVSPCVVQLTNPEREETSECPGPGVSGELMRRSEAGRSLERKFDSRRGPDVEYGRPPMNLRRRVPGRKRVGAPREHSRFEDAEDLASTRY